MLLQVEQRLGFECFLRRQGRLFPTREGRALLPEGDDVCVLALPADAVETLAGPFGYPIGRLHGPGLAREERQAGAGAALRQWWNVALAVEIGAAAVAAVDLTVQYGVSYPP